MKFPEHICSSLCFLYQCETSCMNQNIYIYCPISTFGIPSTIVYGVKVSDTLSLYGNLISKSTPPSISDLVIRRVYFLNGNAWCVPLAFSFIIHIDCSIISSCSCFAYMCSKPGGKDVSNVLMLNSFSPWYFVILKHLVSNFNFFP